METRVRELSSIKSTTDIDELEVQDITNTFGNQPHHGKVLFELW